MRFFQDIRRILTLTCDESTRLMSDSLDTELPYGERLAFRLHSVICLHCRRFSRQIRFLRVAMKRLAADAMDESSPSAQTLSPSARTSAGSLSCGSPASASRRKMLRARTAEYCR